MVLVALPPAAAGWAVVMVMAALALGVGLGQLFEAVGAQTPGEPWFLRSPWNELILGATVAAQLAVTRGLARGLGEPDRGPALARLGLIVGFALFPGPLLFLHVTGRIADAWEEQEPAIEDTAVSSARAESPRAV